MGMHYPSFVSIQPLGFSFAGARHWIDQKDPSKTARKIASDASISLMTTPNASFPSHLFTVVDPAVVEILTAPEKATEIFSERRVGDWSIKRAEQPIREYVGKTEPYNDRSDTTTSSVNYNYAGIENYLFQTFVTYGELELAMASVAGMNLATDKQTAAATILKSDENRFYLKGVQGTDVYGILNHPRILPSVNPLPWTPSGSSTPVTLWKDKDAQAIYDDISFLFSGMAKRGNGTIDERTPLKLVVSPEVSVLLIKRTRTSDNMSTPSVVEMLSESFPNLSIVTLPELGSDTDGETVMLIAPTVGGNMTGELLFSEKARTFMPFTRHTTVEQKWMAGTWGFHLHLPVGISTMTGV